MCGCRYYFASVCADYTADILQLTQAGTQVLASTLKYDCKYAPAYCSDMAGHLIVQE